MGSAIVQHIAIFVKDLERTAGFYERVFELRRASKVDPGPMFNMAVLNMTDGKNCTITLIQPTYIDEWRDWKYETFGVNHIGFMVKSLEQTLSLLSREPDISEPECIEIHGQPLVKFRDMNGTEIDIADARYQMWSVSD